jgi:UDP-3-O-acyl-N-acetylglucosamine deacetylase
VVEPGPPGGGIRFVRTDLSPPAELAATLALARPAQRRSVLADGRTRVETAEHLLGALFALGIADARVLLDAPEPPILDGSAAPFAEALLAASVPGPGTTEAWVVERPALRVEGEGRCDLAPERGCLVVDCLIDFADPGIGRQRLALTVGPPERFLQEIAPARTFGRLAEAEALRRQGLALGAHPSNVLVFGDHGPLTAPRFVDEPVRHKVLDALGELALLGLPLQGRLSLRRCSHRLLVATLRQAVASGALARRPIA